MVIIFLLYYIIKEKWSIFDQKIDQKLIKKLIFLIILYRRPPQFWALRAQNYKASHRRLALHLANFKFANLKFTWQR